MIWFLAPPRLVDAREVRIALSCQMAPIFYRNRGGWQGLGVEMHRWFLNDSSQEGSQRYRSTKERMAKSSPLSR